MSRIQDVLAAGREARRPLVIPFLTAGFPRLDATVPLVEGLVAGGADMVEIGIPFSDPLADGPTIQRASQAALRNGMSLQGVLDAVQALRSRGRLERIPIVLMGYCNPMFRYGLDRFLDAALQVGVDGLIVPDLPPEEATEYRAGCVQRGLAAIFLLAPNASEQRMERVDATSTDFSYCVSITGVTGAREQVQERTVDFLRRVRAVVRKPFVVGFGVRNGSHVEALGPYADGVVVGSALIDRIDEARDATGAVTAAVADLREAAERVARRPTAPEQRGSS